MRKKINIVLGRLATPPSFNDSNLDHCSWFRVIWNKERKTMLFQLLSNTSHSSSNRNSCVSKLLNISFCFRDKRTSGVELFSKENWCKEGPCYLSSLYLCSCHHTTFHIIWSKTCIDIVFCIFIFIEHPTNTTRSLDFLKCINKIINTAQLLRRRIFSPDYKR